MPQVIVLPRSRPTLPATECFQKLGVAGAGCSGTETSFILIVSVAELIRTPRIFHPNTGTCLNGMSMNTHPAMGKKFCREELPSKTYSVSPLAFLAGTLRK